MLITVNQIPTPLKGREQKKGAESPAASVIRMDGSVTVVGSLQIDAQLILSLPTLASEHSVGLVRDFHDSVSGVEGLSFVVVTTDDESVCREFLKANEFPSLEIVRDREQQFGSRFGVVIAEGEFEGSLAQAVFVVDREGILSYVRVAPELGGEADREGALEAARSSAAAKKKGHSGGHMHGW